MNDISPKIKLNDEQEHAVRQMLEGKGHLLITGVAGTGKTAVIKEFQRRNKKNLVCLAPTGLAAQNIGGATIHRFFGFPNSITQPLDIKRKLLLDSTEVILIDEVSMLSSYYLEALVAVLRKNSLRYNNNLDFAGKQMIFVGDFCQLPPVIDNEKLYDYIMENYGGPYTFFAPEWRIADIKPIILKQVHRQTDPNFLSFLNNLRTVSLGAYAAVLPDLLRKQLEFVNRNCVRQPDSDDAFTICTTKKLADQRNRTMIDNLHSKEYFFNARVKGIFPYADYPIDFALKLKEGMRVMLAANKYNDGGELEYNNGSFGVITACNGDNSDVVRVLLDDGREVDVIPHDWENLEYERSRDENGKEIITPTPIGTFTQMPILPGYAISIHKSQGKTFDKVHIMLDGGCFASGQLYTALSRCRTLDGITLSSRIRSDDIFIDEIVVSYYKYLEAQIQYS